jgi:hypothetical protein
MDINVAEATAASQRQRKEQHKPVEPVADDLRSKMASLFFLCPIEEVRFKLPAGKIKAFPQRNADDVTETTRLAHVLIRLGLTDTRFHASIYQVVTKATGEVDYKLQLPSSGSFPAIKAVFVSEGTGAEHVREYCDAVVSKAFAPWWKSHLAGKPVDMQTANVRSGVKLDIERV